MRRIALAVGPVFALVVATVPMIPAQASIPADSASSASHSHATASRARGTTSRAAGLDTSTAAVGATYVSVSWKWIRAATGYRVQVARHQDFSDVITTRTTRNASHRPHSGRQATTVGRLHDATYYWARVRKVKGAHPGPWSAPVRVATKAHWPDPISRAHGGPGAEPGETRIHWKTNGGYTDFFRITTALTPFGSKSTPHQGRNSRTFKVPGTARSLTLTPEQVADAGAGLGTGRHLFFRITAVRAGEADSQARPYWSLLSTTVAGEHSTMNGTQMRFGAYNMHVQAKDIPGHPWKKRQYLIAKNIARQHPDVMGLEELMPGMWKSDDGGIGLQAALRRAGATSYKLTRETGYWDGAGQDTRILYDTNKVAMTSSCSTTVASCYITLPDPLHRHIAAYARFRDLTSGQEFYFVSAHLSPGNDAKTDALRGLQAQAIDAGMAQVNGQGLPVIIASDFNSSQTSRGVDAPHTAMLNAGWYNTSAAAIQKNLQYNSMNGYARHEKPSNYGFGSLIDTLMTLHMPGADRFVEVRTGPPWPTDHNMIYTDVRLP